ncbi:hypothetical protein NLI96_g4480 [Meripilus lineatus]|uniref:Uncharacterized protein n=1 Tax=Meripilus lineatus TaxID=2056292 RepID=A0AAD5V4R3_9APHY|nr:hypothetical protein NLI96_g4480 [Physisporinus lineatus]
MPSPALQRSSSQHITIPTGVAGNLKITSSLLPHTTTSPVNSLKRKHSEISTLNTFDDIPESIDMPLLSPSTTLAGPPSPAPTEIIDVEPEDFIKTSIRHGVKSRDFGRELIHPPVPEVWVRPVQALAQHDMYIRRPQSGPYYSLSGKSLWRLLYLGWVTREEAKRHWQESDWKNLNEYEGRPSGPYPFVISPGRPKPTASYRAVMRIQLYGESEPEDVPEEMIYTPPDEPGMWDGDKEVDAEDIAQQKRRGELEAVAESQEETGAETSTSTPSAPGPEATPSQPTSSSSESLPDTPIIMPTSASSAEAIPQIRRTPSITFTIPSSATVSRTPPLPRSSSCSDLVSVSPATSTEESQPRQSRRGLGRAQTLVLVR